MLGVTLLAVLGGCGAVDQQAASPTASTATDIAARATAASLVNNVTVPLQPGWNGLALQSQ